MEQLMGILRDEKVSTTLLITLGLTVWWMYGWAEERYVHNSEFEEVRDLLVQHIEDQRIVNASQLIRDKELALQVAEATGQPSQQTTHLKLEVAQAREYRACLLDKKPNCQHLKPPD